MGVFSTFSGKCPTCTKDIQVQSKDFEYARLNIAPGDFVDGGGNLSFEDDSYPWCDCKSDEPIFVVIRNNFFIGFTRDKAEAIKEFQFEKNALSVTAEIYEQGLKDGKDKPTAFRMAMDSYNEEFEKAIKSSF